MVRLSPRSPRVQPSADRVAPVDADRELDVPAISRRSPMAAEYVVLQIDGQIDKSAAHDKAPGMDQTLRLRDQMAHNSAALKAKSRAGTQPHCVATTGTGATKVTTAMRESAAAARAELSAPPMKPSRPR